MTRARTVLVVDDDELLRMSICDALQDEGYATIGAADGSEALLRLRDGAPRPDLILLDLMMPTMNGWQFLEAQRSDPAIASIPVVVLTAIGSKAKANVNVAEVLLKPVRLDDLLAVVARANGCASGPD